MQELWLDAAARSMKDEGRDLMTHGCVGAAGCDATMELHYNNELAAVVTRAIADHADASEH